MKALKQLFKWVGYTIVHAVIGTICFLVKFGVAEQLCIEFKASIALGSGAGAYLRGNYDKAYEVLSPYLEVENDNAFGGIKYQLALLFYYGRGVTIDRTIANRLFSESALLGWDDARKYLNQVNEKNNTKT